MANVLIRDVPDDVHTELRRRAQRHGQSMQQYLLGVLQDIVRLPHASDWAADAALAAPTMLDGHEAVSLIRADRDAGH